MADLDACFSWAVRRSLQGGGNQCMLILIVHLQQVISEGQVGLGKVCGVGSEGRKTIIWSGQQQVKHKSQYNRKSSQEPHQEDSLHKHSKVSPSSRWDIFMARTSHQRSRHLFGWGPSSQNLLQTAAEFSHSGSWQASTYPPVQHSGRDCT